MFGNGSFGSWMFDNGGMVNSLVNKLHDSIQEQERSLRVVKRAAATCDPVPFVALRKIADAEEILDTQKKLTVKTAIYLSTGHFEEVNRAVRLIQGLSAMLHDDTKDILAEISRVSSLSANTASCVTVSCNIDSCITDSCIMEEPSGDCSSTELYAAK